MPPWTVSATTLVRNMFSTKRYLKSQDIWAMGTAGERPVLQEQVRFSPDGRIRMKKVSNIREGRRIWVPPPTVALPNHPFQSKRFLKDNILTSLASQNLIHNAKILVPITTKEGLLQAEKTAAKRFRRMQHDYSKGRRDDCPTLPPAPSTMTASWYWTLGPPPMEGEKREPAPLDEPLTEEEVKAKMIDWRWEEAEELEKAFWRAREAEEELIAARKAVRKEKTLEQRARMKEMREEDRALGREGLIAQEKRRTLAVHSIEQYAQLTGEDVSGWFDEIEKIELPNAHPGPVPDFLPKDTLKVDGRVRLTPVPPRPSRTKLLRALTKVRD